MPELKNVMLLGADALLYFAVLATLFGLRHKIGIGAFFCTLGVMHFIETYLASTFYVPLPFGVIASPGSAVLFTGKLMMLLLVYIREDAEVVRQPIYGLLIGNILMVALALVVRQHALIPSGPGRIVDVVFINEMGSLMIWGTLLLFIDSILIILLYERSRSWFGENTLLRIGISAAIVLTFDQIGFFLGLKFLFGADWRIMVGGWAAKMVMVAIYSILLVNYLRRFERSPAESRRRIADVFSVLTYRERYEELLARSERDELTGMLDRGELETYGRSRVNKAVTEGRPTSLLMIDVDDFKVFNSKFGHAAGDAALRSIAMKLASAVRNSDRIFRYGGEEFVIICDNLNAEMASTLGERIRHDIEIETGWPSRQTVSVGVASCLEDASNYEDMFAIADRRLYEAKETGRNRVIGRPTA